MIPIVLSALSSTLERKESISVTSAWLAGKPLWEPSEVKAPTLIVVGEWDTLLTGAQAVFGKLSNALYKRLVQIGHGTHLLFLEKNRIQLFREVQLFLDESHSAN